MSGIPLILAFIIAIIIMIVIISKLKVHPFLAIMIVSLVFGIVAGIPLTSTTLPDGTVQPSIVEVISAGFSGTFSSIGIVIILGALIGNILETSGAAIKLADMIVRLVGKKRPELAMLFMGWIVAIPVFCDSGFVILNPIRKALRLSAQASSVAMTVTLSAGLYIAHVFIPPTPGPIAAANTLGIGNNLMLVIGMGVLVSIAPLIAAYCFAKFIGNHVKAKDESEDNKIIESYENLTSESLKLPNGWMVLSPILVPIMLMALGSISSMAGWKGIVASVCAFFGAPIIALAMGVVLGILLMVFSGIVNKLYAVTESTLKTVGPILFITAAGGVLGKVISSTALVPFITENSAVFEQIGIFFPFLLAAILKTAQGSSTVAITTTAGILAPLTGILGLTSPAMSALTVMAIGAGAMTVSHANDSYFWVVTNFGGMNTSQGYKTQTLCTLIMGIASILWIFLISLVL